MLQSTFFTKKNHTRTKSTKLTVKKPTDFDLPHRFEGRDEEGQSEQTNIRRPRRKLHKNESSSLKLTEVRQKHRV